MNKITTQEIERIQQYAYQVAMSFGAYNALDHILNLFIKGYSNIILDCTTDAPAQINMQNFDVIMNPEIISQSVVEICVANQEHYPAKSKIIKLTKQLIMFLGLHELGHYLYSPSTEIEIQNLQKYCKGIPLEFCQFLLNVVEDIFIQTQYLRDYPSKTYKDAMLFGQKYMQGIFTVQSYGQAILQEPIISIRNKLYYFILRGYNPASPDILNFWGCRDKFGWSDNVIHLFEQAQHYTQPDSRCCFCCEVLIPAAFQELIEKIQDQGGLTEDDLASLLDSDKIYMNDNNNQGAGDQTNSDSDADNTQKKQSQQQSSSPIQSDTLSDDSDSSKNGSSEQDAAYSKKAKSRTSSDHQGASKDLSGMVDGEQRSSQNTPDQLNTAISQICKELNKEIGEGSPRNTENTQNALLPNTDENMKRRRMEGSNCQESDALKQDVSSLSNMSDSKLRIPGQQLYQACAPYLAKIFNLHNETVHYLNDGDIDESTLIDWYTERSLEIYKQDINLVHDRNILVSFIIDRSGSMDANTASGLDRYLSCANLCAALCHGFDDVGIRSSIYLFDDDSIKVKDFKDPSILTTDYRSNVYEVMSRMGTGGCTDPSGAFQDIIDSQSEYDNVDTAKILFFVTDGYVNGDKELVKQQIQELIAIGWLVVPIGLDFSSTDLKNLQQLTAPAVVRNYKSATLVSVLGEDIYNLIVDNFILIK